jgi:hypothetical protein
MKRWVLVRAVRVVVVVVVAAVGLAGVPVTPSATAAAASGSNPIGSFDSFALHAGATLVPSTGNPGPSTWTVYGWAADADAPGQPVPIHVYVNGVGAAIGSTGSPRADVAAAVGYAGPNAGFQLDVPIDVGATVCAYAINVGAGTANTPLGCRTVDGRDHADPVGAWDLTTAQPGAVRLAGWTADPDRAYDLSAAVGDVRVYMDGTIWGELYASTARPDVAAAVPWAGPYAGFDRTILALPGIHQICLFSLNLGTRGIQNLTLGCRTVSVAGVTPPAAGEPHGSLDNLTFGGTSVRALTWTASGWAFDPLGGGAAAVLLRWSFEPVDVYSGEPFSTPQFGDTSASTNLPRPDVRAAFPSAPLNTGWKLDTAELARAVCAYAISPASSHGERLLGCWTNPQLHGPPFGP